MDSHCCPRAFSRLLPRWAVLAPALLVLTLAGCRASAGGRAAAPAAAPAATATAPAPAAPTATPPPPSPTPIPPTSTPDVALLPEEYEHPQGFFRLRHPAGWSSDDLSDEDEVLVSFRGPIDQGEALFLVNLVNPGGELGEPHIPVLVESYLDDFFGEQLDQVALSRDTLPDGVSRVVARGPGDSPEQQLHLEFRFASRPPLFQTLVMLSSEAAWPAAQPLLAGMADSFQLDVAKAGALPVASVQTAGATVEGLELVNTNHFTAATGSLYFVGEVRNSGSQPYQEVEVTVFLLDGSGTELARETWRTRTALVQPGETSPVIVIFDKPPAGWSELKTSIAASPADFYLNHTYADLTIQQDTGGTPGFGDYQITGAVINSGEETARFVEVVGTLYDAEGKVLAVESTFLKQETLEPGATAAFELVFFEKAQGEVANYSVIARGARVEHSQEQGEG